MNNGGLGTPTRFEGLDSDLLEEAARSLAHRLSISDWRMIDWEVGRTRHRPRSTIYPLTAIHEGRRISAFFKRAHARTSTSEEGKLWERELRDGMARSDEMEQCLETACSFDGVQIARTLASDPDRLSSITLGVEGVAMGRLWHRSLNSSRRTACHRLVEKVGNAVNAIETCSPPIDSIHERLVGESVVDRRIYRVRDLIPHDLVQPLSNVLGSLEVEARSRPEPYVFAHGDLNSSNVLMRRSGVSLIDFAWLPRLRGYDVSHFAFRLEYDIGSPPGFARDLVRSLLEGYGDPGVENDPAWKFLRLSKLLRLIDRFGGSSSWPRRRRAERALEEVEALVAGG